MARSTRLDDDPVIICLDEVGDEAASRLAAELNRLPEDVIQDAFSVLIHFGLSDAMRRVTGESMPGVFAVARAERLIRGARDSNSWRRLAQAERELRRAQQALDETAESNQACAATLARYEGPNRAPFNEVLSAVHRAAESGDIWFESEGPGAALA